MENGSTRLRDLERFYGLLDELSRIFGGPRLLGACHGRMDFPERGIYFFFEPGENRTDSGFGPRVVRIGTHALKAGSRTTLWKRLSQHRGQVRTGTGNHRGSIFRLLVGGALQNRGVPAVPTWGKGSSAPREVRDGERNLEQQVSQTIGRMPILWLSIPDAPGPGSLRGTLERNAVALLSNYRRPALDPPSPDWLGHHSDREKVRESGLWNQHHVDELHDPAFLDLLERLVTTMASER
ncbi:MAG TPA: hypothetical protein VKA64_04585 [Gammaproteobacteria bacterium]|nr:hypothetical protein [Gammaproteobacteria bacterium]